MPNPLSKGEMEVLILIAEGLRNKAIADELFIDYETVRTRIKQIKKKLHARTPAHAVAIAKDNKWI